MSENYGIDEKKSIDSINAAKLRLLELEAVEKTANKLEEVVETEAHFVSRRSMFLLAGEIIIVCLSVAELFYYVMGYAPFDTFGLFSILSSIVVAGVLVWRLDGWRRADRNKRQLHNLKQTIEEVKTDAEKIID